MTSVSLGTSAASSSAVSPTVVRFVPGMSSARLGASPYASMTSTVCPTSSRTAARHASASGGTPDCVCGEKSVVILGGRISVTCMDEFRPTRDPARRDDRGSPPTPAAERAPRSACTRRTLRRMNLGCQRKNPIGAGPTAADHRPPPAAHSYRALPLWGTSSTSGTNPRPIPAELRTTFARGRRSHSPPAGASPAHDATLRAGPS